MFYASSLDLQIRIFLTVNNRYLMIALCRVYCTLCTGVKYEGSNITYYVNNKCYKTILFPNVCLGGLDSSRLFISSVR